MASEEVRKNLQELIGKSVPNGVIINGVLGWVHAASGSLSRNQIKRVLASNYNKPDLDEAKKLLVETVKEALKNEKDMSKALGGRQDPGKKEKICNDIVDILAKLDEKNITPVIILTSGDLKVAPPLGDPEENMEHVAAKVKVLETCIR